MKRRATSDTMSCNNGKYGAYSPWIETFHPYSEEFDSGVDDTHYPNHYIVWNMNAASHIYPEYVVTFKITSDPQEVSEETENTDLRVAEDASIDDVHEDEVDSESSASVWISHIDYHGCKRS